MRPVRDRASADARLSPDRARDGAAIRYTFLPEPDPLLPEVGAGALIVEVPPAFGAPLFVGFEKNRVLAGSASGRISGVVKNTPSGVGFGVEVTNGRSPVKSCIRSNMAKSSCTVLWQWLT